MSLTVRNIGVLQFAGGATVGRKDTQGGEAQYSDRGTVRVVFEGREYVFGPNQAITFYDDGIGAAVAAADSRLRVASDLDGGDNVGRASLPSVVLRAW